MLYFKVKFEKLCYPIFNVELSINFKYTIQLKQACYHENAVMNCINVYQLPQKNNVTKVTYLFIAGISIVD